MGLTGDEFATPVQVCVEKISVFPLQRYIIMFQGNFTPEKFQKFQEMLSTRSELGLIQKV